MNHIIFFIHIFLVFLHKKIYQNLFLDGGATSPPFTRPDPLGQGSNFLGSGKPPYPTPGKPIGEFYINS